MRQVPFRRSGLPPAVRERLGRLLLDPPAPGARVAELETRLAERFRTPGIRATSSGREAVVLAIQAVGLDDHAEIVLPAIVRPELVSTILAARAVPRLADVDPHSGRLTPRTLEDALSPRTRAVVIPALGGVIPDVTEVFERLRDRDIALLFDVTGCTRTPEDLGLDQATLVFGDLDAAGVSCGIASGFVGSPIDRIATRLVTGLGSGRTPRDFKSQRKIPSPYDLRRPGLDGGVDEWRAMALVEILRDLDDDLAHRVTLAARLDERLTDVPGLRRPPRSPDPDHVPFRVDRGLRRLVLRFLQDRGIEATVMHPCLTRLSYFETYFHDLELPGAGSFGDAMVALPLHAGLGTEDVDVMVDQLQQAFRRYRRRR